MQTGKNAKESTKAAMEKTKATLQEKVDKTKAHDPMEKGMATARKEERIEEAELNKQQNKDYNAAEKEAATTAKTTGWGPTGTGGHAHGYGGSHT
ncbi:hypothetical protein UlMin_005156 [Ulmus minor]